MQPSVLKHLIADAYPVSLRKIPRNETAVQGILFADGQHMNTDDIASILCLKTQILGKAPEDLLHSLDLPELPELSPRHALKLHKDIGKMLLFVITVQ